MKVLNYFTACFIMSNTLKKILIVLPVFIISLFYLEKLYSERYSGASFKRVAGLIITVLLLYAWIIIVATRRKQDGFFENLVLSSYFVYVFAVLTLTGYFILFREISSNDWWGNMMQRVERGDHVNLEVFKTINMYKTFGKQNLGNFVMLLPLGIYLPLMYKKSRRPIRFFFVGFICFLTSAGIELVQLATSYRSTDVDDVVLNTAGGCCGFIFFLLLRVLIIGRVKKSPA
jgi:glycopeptide antibiotics resistance protein